MGEDDTMGAEAQAAQARDDRDDTEITLRGPELVLRSGLGLAAVPALRGLVMPDARRPHLYRARPADLATITSVIREQQPVYLTFDPAPPLDVAVRLTASPRPYQDAALRAWEAAGRRGVVVLPTGAGKTLVGAMAIAHAATRALVIVPTIVLCEQWREALASLLGLPASAVGMVGDGKREWECPVVVATYDGAARALGRISSFGLLVADEVHHLPADTYRAIAEAAVAPFRLGLSATLARSDGRESDLTALLGEVVYTERAAPLSEEGYLAPFAVVRLDVDLGADDRDSYDRDMAIFQEYRAKTGRRGEPMLFALERIRRRSVGDRAARAALLAYQRARTLALTSRAKIDALEPLLERHAAERCIVFAEHVAAVEAIGRAYLMPTITGQTPATERAALTDDFRAGLLTKIATSRVWNEGVDVPEAAVAIVIAGTGMERDAVQRLGRILRPAPDKRAILYEVVTRDTADEGIAARRRLRPDSAEVPRTRATAVPAPAPPLPVARRRDWRP